MMTPEFVRSRYRLCLALSFLLVTSDNPHAADVMDAPDEITDSINPVVPKTTNTPASNPETATLRTATDAYRRGDVTAGDAIAARLTQPPLQVAAEWVAIRSSSSLSFERLNRFISANPDLPMQATLLKRAEEALFISRASTNKVLDFFGKRDPESPAGRAILASAKATSGQLSEAHQLALAAWRDRRTTRDIADYIAKTFPELITPEQRALRAHLLILNNQRGEGLRLAATLGVDHLKLAEGLALASSKGSSMQVLDGVATSLRSHSSFKLARAQVLRRQDKLDAARDVMFTTTQSVAEIADPDETWTERRVLARRLLDAGDAAGAFRVAAEHSARSVGRQAEAEFHAGWIALRYLNYPQTALMHFEKSAAIAELTSAKSRAAYWRGRALEAGALGDNDSDSRPFYEAAARFPATYYGQLAAARISQDILAVPVHTPSDHDEPRFLASPSGALIQNLLDAGLREFALPVALDLARTSSSPAQIDAAARRFADLNDAGSVLAIGRMATARSLPLEHHAFPTFGIPEYKPLPGSAEKAMVYAIARQESAFQTKAVSHANARGLMQMLPSTASRTAQKFKVSFSPNRLTEDPAFCAQLGAAHLGELMEETKGSLVMTFASYNAGGGRVREWIAAAGDPRQPGVDVVDWVERIPFYETRNYVQRIMENLQVYRARMQGNQSTLLISEDMETGRRR
jgi:soluble lytic murein transglycosylase